MDYSLQGSSVHGILQARILDWIAIPFSRRYSRPRDRTQVYCIEGRFFTIWVTEILNKIHEFFNVHETIDKIWIWQDIFNKSQHMKLQMST